MTKYIGFQYSVATAVTSLDVTLCCENPFDVLAIGDGVGGLSSLGHTDLFFIDQGTKVNGKYYQDVLIHQQLLPAIRDLSGDFFTFQQDNAPAHRVHETVQLLTWETPEFIALALWPADSPDLSPVDYQIWGKLQERVYRRQIHDVDQLN